jgi:hypothetical protein|eukprot:COSAG06_NODE_3694_length_4999_cov_18.414490_7_plen_201_part_00
MHWIRTGAKHRPRNTALFCFYSTSTCCDVLSLPWQLIVFYRRQCRFDSSNEREGGSARLGWLMRLFVCLVRRDGVLLCHEVQELARKTGGSLTEDEYVTVCMQVGSTGREGINQQQLLAVYVDLKMGACANRPPARQTCLPACLPARTACPRACVPGLPPRTARTVASLSVHLLRLTLPSCSAVALRCHRPQGTSSRTLS